MGNHDLIDTFKPRWIEKKDDYDMRNSVVRGGLKRKDDHDMRNSDATQFYLSSLVSKELKLSRWHHYNPKLRTVAIFIVILQRSSSTRLRTGALSHEGRIRRLISCVIQAS